MGVIIPNHNDKAFLSDCLSSTLLQTEPFDQLIYVDDCSTDESFEYAKEILKQRKEAVLVCSEKREGTVAAIKKGLQASDTDFVLFLSANDFITLQLVERFRETITSDTGVWSALSTNISTDGKNIWPRPSPVISQVPRVFDPFDARRMLSIYTNWFSGTTLLFNRKHLEDIGGLPVRLGGLADWLAATMLCAKHGMVFLPEIIGFVREHRNNYLNQTLANSGTSLEKSVDKYLLEHKEKANLSQDILEKLKARIRFNVVKARSIELRKKGISVNVFSLNCSRVKLFMLIVLLQGRNIFVWLYAKHFLYRIAFNKFLNEKSFGKNVSFFIIGQQK